MFFRHTGLGVSITSRWVLGGRQVLSNLTAAGKKLLFSVMMLADNADGAGGIFLELQSNDVAQNEQTVFTLPLSHVTLVRWIRCVSPSPKCKYRITFLSTVAWLDLRLLSLCIVIMCVLRSV